MQKSRIVVVTFILFSSIQALAGTGDVGSVDQKPFSKKANFTDCLVAINEKSVALKNKIIPLDDDGWSFVVKGEDPQNMTIYTEAGEKFQINHSHRISNKGIPKYSTCENISDSNFQGVRVVNQIYDQAIKNDPKNSLENKREIVRRCKSVGVGVPWPEAGTGMMMGGTGSMMGTGSIMGTPPSKGTR
ncbi:hypothetical protein [Bdellovibrio bacteriovorus]|uniref:hypothetical protein n=1 Tax=Bdellovibrio TaxID=958 RepID=UPI0035A8AB7F